MDRPKNIMLKLIKKQVKSIDPGADIILYGSRARGDERADSDWDILILVDSKVDVETEKTFRHNLYDIELEFGESLSTFVFNKHDWNSNHWMTAYYKNVSDQGIAI
jgi:uncharacterized protein